MQHLDQQPLVSVIVPAFNARTTLAETLSSVANQRYRTLEIVIVDDGSTDATARIAADFACADGRARVLTTANGGVAAARNAGIAASSGAFVAPIDADDLWHPDYLMKLVARLLATKTSFVYAAPRLIDAASRVIGNGLNARAEGNVAFRMQLCNLVGNGSGMVVTRPALEAVGGYDPRLHAAGCQGYEDYLLQLKLASHGAACAVDEYLVGYRQAEGAMSRDLDRMLRSRRLARRLHAEAGPAEPPRCLRRWIAAHDRLLAAQAAANGRRFGRAAVLFAGAAFIDPIAAATALAGRTTSLIRRERAPTPAGVRFLDADPTLPNAGTPDGLARPNLFVRLLMRRLAHVARLDAGGA